MSSTQSIAASIEERLLVPTYATHWAPASIAAHRSLALPLQLVGQVHRWTVGVGSTQLSLVGIGREKLIAPLWTRLFGQLPEPCQEAHRMLWSPAALEDTGADMVLVEVHRWTAARFRRSGWMIIPEAVRWQGDLAQVPPAKPCRSLADDLRKVRKYGYTITHTTALEDWDDFYREMILPQARARHGATAWIPSRRLMSELAGAGTLHLVHRDGVRVAGVCSLRRDDTIWLPVSGILQGNERLLRQGAGSAALALTLDWARSQGFRRVDMGRTGPFIRDGLQQFKRKWGLLPTPDPLAHVAAVRVSSAAAREAFVCEPVLVEDGAALRVYAGEAS